MTTRKQPGQADITTDILASDEFTKTAYVPPERMVLAIYDAEAKARAEQQRAAAYAAAHARAEQERAVDYDVAYAQAEIAVYGCLETQARAKDPLYDAQLLAFHEPVLAERKGITSLLIAEGLHISSGKTVDNKERQSAEPHRRLGKGEQDGPQYGKSRVTTEERVDNEKNRRRADRVDAAIAFTAS